MTTHLHPETLAAQMLGEIDPVTRAVVPALHPATTYERDPDNQFRSGRIYARADNPTYDPPERLLAALEGAPAALSFASGMAAATAVFMTLEPGDHVVAPRVMYWALRGWLKRFCAQWRVEADFVDADSTDALAAAVRPGRTKLVWVETPANPTWAVTDLAAAAEIAHNSGARLAVDNTVPTPVLTRPLALGADIVMHSATKYLNGHSDVVGGMLATAREDSFWERITALRASAGSILGTFEAWLLQRGMRTLFVRVERACRTAERIAAHFAGDPRVTVLYPGLPEFPGHDVAARQMQGGFGGMLSIRVAGGAAAAIATAARVKVWKRATSLGGVESLVEHRHSVEDAESLCPPDLLRLSVGIERADDLIADLDQALGKAALS
ncbi:MAG TPA: PLP-dependent transferase [Stellaceae bacterium]|nr:PLP-dependent transferase [Stellaceae bacterium]